MFEYASNFHIQREYDFSTMSANCGGFSRYCGLWFQSVSDCKPGEGPAHFGFRFPEVICLWRPLFAFNAPCSHSVCYLFAALMLKQCRIVQVFFSARNDALARAWGCRVCAPEAPGCSAPRRILFEMASSRRNLFCNAFCVISGKIHATNIFTTSF